MLPDRLQRKLTQRREANAGRALPAPSSLVDFSSNDYLGFSKHEGIYKKASQLLKDHGAQHTGATGSRLLSGNHVLYEAAENHLAKVHRAPAALMFNSGYDANVGFFGSVPQRGDVVFYDEYIHASIRDGILLGRAKSYKFRHNDWNAIVSMAEAERQRHSQPIEIYVVTESLFSMDGDSPDLVQLAIFCARHQFRLVVDEAHALGVVGNGYGLVQHLGLEKLVFARLVTFGKALGCHGAAILGSGALKDYLVNFARSFIYTTALPPHSVASVLAAYGELPNAASLRERLGKNCDLFREALNDAVLVEHPKTLAPIHSILLPGNDRVRGASQHLAEKGFGVRPILSPTVPAGKERLRICMHSFNTESQILELAEHLNTLINL